MDPRYVAAALGGVALLIAGGLIPALADGGPPTVTSLAPNPAPADSAIVVKGTGCKPDSPVSMRAASSSDEIANPPLNHHSTDSGVTADAEGDFKMRVPLRHALTLEHEYAVAVSCTSTFDPAEANDVASDESYLFVKAAEPHVTIKARAKAAYKSRPVVRVLTSDAPGTLQVKVGGTLIYSSDDTGAAAHEFRLPPGLRPADHTLTATYDESEPGVAAVSTTDTIRINKAPSKAVLNRGTRQVLVGQKVKLTVEVTTIGRPPGKVIIKDGQVARGTFTLTSADEGKKTVWITLPKSGERRLSAHFRGNPMTKASVSKKVTVNVR